jgi:hypothetical protein
MISVQFTYDEAQALVDFFWSEEHWRLFVPVLVERRIQICLPAATLWHQQLEEGRWP